MSVVTLLDVPADNVTFILSTSEMFGNEAIVLPRCHQSSYLIYDRDIHRYKCFACGKIASNLIHKFETRLTIGSTAPQPGFEAIRENELDLWMRRWAKLTGLEVKIEWQA